MTEIERLKIKCNDYANRLVIEGYDDVEWEARSTTSDNKDYIKCLAALRQEIGQIPAYSALAPNYIMAIINKHFATTAQKNEWKQ